MLCPVCRASDAGSRPVSLNAQKFLRLLDREGLAAAARIAVDDALAGEIEAMLGQYLAQLAERDLASLRVMRAMQAGAS